MININITIKSKTFARFLTNSLYNNGSSSLDRRRDKLWLSLSERGDDIGEPLTVLETGAVLADTTFMGSLFLCALLLLLLLLFLSGVVFVVDTSSSVSDTSSRSS